MSSYEEEIFNYLTSKENFHLTFEIFQLFPEIKNQLIKEFWDIVYKKVKEKLEDTDAKIEISENVFETWSSLFLYYNGNKNIRIGFEQLHVKTYYGVWINAVNENLDRERIDEYVRSIESVKLLKKTNYWLGWEYINADFNNIGTLKKVLPYIREEYANEIASLLIEFSKRIKQDIIEMNKMIKS